MNLNPAELLNPIFNALDSLIENDGVFSGGVSPSANGMALGGPTKERFQHAPGGGAHQALSFVRNFLGFETDSSRSYAKLIWLNVK